MKKVAAFIFVAICALVPFSTKAQSTNWTTVPGWAWQSAVVNDFYHDTTTNTLYTIGCTQGVIAYDGLNFSYNMQHPCGVFIRELIRFNDTLFLAGFCDGLSKWNGTNWDTSGLSANGPIVTLCVWNGELYAGGAFTSIGGVYANCLAKYNGMNWSAVPGLHIDYVSSIACLYSYNNDLYIGGQFMDSLGNNILRWDGSLLHSVDGGLYGGIDEVNTMTVFNGELYIGGAFSTASGNPGDHIVKWDGNTLSDVGGGLGIPNPSDQVFDLLVYNNYLYASGNFSSAGGCFADRIARWDGTNWCGFGDTLNNAVLALGTLNNELYIGGSIWFIGNDTIIGGLMQWTGGSFVDTCGNMTAVAEQYHNSENLSIYPNPATGSTTVKINGAFSKATFCMFDQFGRPVLNKAINSPTSEIDLTGLATGIYFYQFSENGDIRSIGKLIISDH